MGKMVCITSRFGAWMRDAKFALARMLGKLPDGPPAYPPLGAGAILAGSPGAGEYFPQSVSAGGERLDDVLGPEAWLITRPGLANGKLAPFATMLGKWLDTHGAAAVVVRPDRFVFGSGDPAALVQAWQAAVASPLRTTG